MKISVIAPNYNYGEYLETMILSVVSQSYSSIELIIVDDGSTDDSVNVIKKLMLDYPGKIILVEQKNKGQSYALNKALSYVSGEIICWINSDDFFCSNSFEKVMCIFTNNPKIDIVYGNFNIVNSSGQFICTKHHLVFNYFESVFVGFGNCLTSNAIFWKKHLSDKIGNFNEHLKSNMDGEFFARLTFKSNMFFINEPLANFRRQVISIAGINDVNWNTRVKNERMIEASIAYRNLIISKYIDYKYLRFLTYYFLGSRYIRKYLRKCFRKYVMFL